MLFDYQVTSSNFRISQNSKQFYNEFHLLKIKLECRQMRLKIIIM